MDSLTENKIRLVYVKVGHYTFEDENHEVLAKVIFDNPEMVLVKSAIYSDSFIKLLYEYSASRLTNRYEEYIKLDKENPQTYHINFGTVVTLDGVKDSLRQEIMANKNSISNSEMVTILRELADELSEK
jgi:hypothetical protein